MADTNFDYYRIVVGHALAALDTGDLYRAHEILRAGSRGEAIPEDPKQRTLEYCEYRRNWPMSETIARG